jgi:hypothetical protein
MVDIVIPKKKIELSQFEQDRAFTQDRILRSQCLNIVAPIVNDANNRLNEPQPLEAVYKSIVSHAEDLYKLIKKVKYL